MTPAFPSPSHGNPRTPHACKPRARWAAALALCGLALSACGPNVQGSPKPPPAFGPVHGSWFGCPSLQGVYAWPPVDPGRAPGTAPVKRRWEPGSLPFYASGAEMQVWVQQARGEIIMRSRSINRARNVRSSLTREWSYITYSGAQARCSSGMLDVVQPQEAPDSQEASGRSAPQGFRLVLLKDGALAVGTRTLSTGNKGSFFSWGGQSYGSYDLPDVESWTWIKLSRTAAGDKEPPVMDAYVPGATAP